MAVNLRHPGNQLRPAGASRGVSEAIMKQHRPTRLVRLPARVHDRFMTDTRTPHSHFTLHVQQITSHGRSAGVVVGLDDTSLLPARAATPPEIERRPALLGSFKRYSLASFADLHYKGAQVANQDSSQRQPSREPGWCRNASRITQVNLVP